MNNVSNSNFCIFVLSYPNTPEKIDTLRECVSVLKMSEFLVVSVSNYNISDDLLSLFDDYYTGANQDCCFDNIFESNKIDEARQKSKYFFHFNSDNGLKISYKPFSYGRGCTYHWSALNQMNYIIDYSKKKNIMHALVFEGDAILEIEDLPKIKNFFQSMIDEKLKFIIPTSPMFYFMCGNAWFFEIDYVSRCFSDTSCEDFLKSTWPNFSAESYLYNRLINGFETGKILLHEDDNLERNIGNCVIEKISRSEHFSEHNPLNLFFPKTMKVNLSSSIDRIDQNPFEPLTYVDIGVGKLSDQDVLFIWNRYKKTKIEKVLIDVLIKDNETELFSQLYETYPNFWYYATINNLTIYSHCQIKIKVIDTNKKEFHSSYRFEHIKN